MSEPKTTMDRYAALDLEGKHFCDEVAKLILDGREEIEARVRAEEQERLRRCEAAGANLLDKWHAEHARAEQAEARVVLLEASYISHFQRDHLEGDGPEIDRWKLKAAQARREALEAACAAVDNWFNIYFSFSPGQRVIDRIKNEAIRALMEPKP